MSKTRTETNRPGLKSVAVPRVLTLATLVTVCAVQLLLIAGCHRGFYRRQADAEAKRLIREKTGQRWTSATGEIDIDPMSRMFDPFSADHPPIPPDDPSSHKLMHSVDGKPGYPHWHANGNIDQVESPDWQAFLPVNEKGQVVLSLSDAYRLALIHSTDLQQQRETLYLSALEVSIQRFGFDSQLFAGFNSLLTTRGRFNTGTGQSSTTFENSLGVTGGGINAQRLGITGANFVVGLANTILWEFSGNNTQSANSLINFSLIQPLLRDAGRERILESLTQAERTLLANVRQLERFRRGFYLEIATGRNAGAGPAQGSAAFLAPPGFAGTNVGGYLGLLQQKQQIKNIEFSVAQFEALQEQFQELFDSDRINKLQVAQFEASVFQQQQGLVGAKIAYQNALDSFKILLGLPPYLDIVIEDPFLEAFELIDDRFPQQLQDIQELRDRASVPAVAIAEAMAKRKKMREAGEDIDSLNRQLKTLAPQLLPFVKQAELLIKNILDEDRALVAKDIELLKTRRLTRVKYLAKIKDDIQSGRLDSEVEPKVFDPDSIPTSDRLLEQLDGEGNKDSLVALLQGALEELRYGIKLLEDYAESEEMNVGKDAEKLFKRIPDLLNEVNGNVLEMALLQAEARANSIEIAEINIGADQAFETARCLRRDWMNARAALIDQWRQIEFFADQLESQVDLVFTGEVGNANADNPFRIRYEDGSLAAGFRFDAPIVRQAERNAYRQAQISYQQSRRSFYQFEDAISQSLRLTLRTIDQNKVLFELNRKNFQNQIDQVKLNRANLFSPVPQGDTTATFLAQAIQQQTNIQNNYLNFWVQYEVLRRNLDFDMGTMQLDENFEWIDPGEIDASIGQRVAMLEGIAENDRFCCGLTQAGYETSIIEAEETAELNYTGDSESYQAAPVESDQEEGTGKSILNEGFELPKTTREPASSPSVRKPDRQDSGLMDLSYSAKQPNSRLNLNFSSGNDRVGLLNPFRDSAQLNSVTKRLVASPRQRADADSSRRAGPRSHR